MNLRKDNKLKTAKEILLIIFLLVIAIFIAELLITISVFIFFLISNGNLETATSKILLVETSKSYEFISLNAVVQNVITIILVLLFLKGNIKNRIDKIKLYINCNSLALFIYGACLAFITIVIITIVGITSGMSKLTAIGFNTFHQFLKVFIITVITYLSVGFGEEVFFRGYILNKLLGCTSKIRAVVIGAFIFMVFHIGTYSKALDFIDVFLVGIVLSYMYIVFESLWFAIGFHFMWDFAQSFFVKLEDQVIANPTVLQFSVPKDIYINGINIGCRLEIVFIAVDLILIALMIFLEKKKLSEINMKSLS